MVGPASAREPSLLALASRLPDAVRHRQYNSYRAAGGSIQQ